MKKIPGSTASIAARTAARTSQCQNCRLARKSSMVCPSALLIPGARPIGPARDTAPGLIAHGLLGKLGDAADRADDTGSLQRHEDHLLVRRGSDSLQGIDVL